MVVLVLDLVVLLALAGLLLHALGVWSARPAVPPVGSGCPGGSRPGSPTR